MPTRAFRLMPDNPKEIDRQAEIVRYLQWEPKVKFFIRVNGGCTKRHGMLIWFYTLFIRHKKAKGKGVTDLIGMLRDGRWFCIEVKRPNENPTQDQAEFMSLVLSGGGVSGIAETWRDAKKIILESRRD